MSFPKEMTFPWEKTPFPKIRANTFSQNQDKESFPKIRTKTLLIGIKATQTLCPNADSSFTTQSLWPGGLLPLHQMLEKSDLSRKPRVLPRLLQHSCQETIAKMIEYLSESFWLISSFIRTPISERVGVYDSLGRRPCNCYVALVKRSHWS